MPTNINNRAPNSLMALTTGREADGTSQDPNNEIMNAMHIGVTYHIAVGHALLLEAFLNVVTASFQGEERERVLEEYWQSQQ